MTFREVERLVKLDGWKLKNVRGSHYHYTHPNKKGLVTIPYHKGDLSPKTVQSIFKQAGLQ